MPGILASLRQRRRKNLCRYFFFFLPAFFFILVFSLGLDFVAELLFFATGIDTSLTLLLPDKHLETPQLRGLAAPNLAVKRDYRNALFRNQAYRDSFIKKF
jgi:hypothetical protein